MASQVEPLMTPDHSIIAPLIPIPPEESIIASLEETRLLLLAATPFVVTPKHLKNIKVYLQLLSEKVHQNAAKKRAQRILLDIIDSSKRLFLLCALATNLTFLGKIRSHDGHWSLITWWKTIPHPPALDLISDCYAAEFEAKKAERAAQRVRISNPSSQSPALRLPAKDPFSSQSPARFLPAEDPSSSQSSARFLPAEDPSSSQSPARFLPAEDPSIRNLRSQCLFDFLTTYQGGCNMLQIEICGGTGTLEMEFKPLERVRICIQQEALGELLKRSVGDITTGSAPGISIPSEKLFKFITDYRKGCPMLLEILVSFDKVALNLDSTIPITYEKLNVAEVELSLTPKLQESLLDYVMSTYGGYDKSGLGLDFKCFMNEDECI